MSAFVFGQDAPCRACHGAGERVLKMAPQEQRERSRQLRRGRHESAGPLDRASPMKTCPDCQGKGLCPHRSSGQAHRPMTDAMTENGLKQVVLQVAYANGWAVYHVPQATMRNGGGKGYPDLTLARDKEVLWIELKAQDGTISPAQCAWRDALPACHIIRPSDWHSGRVHELLG